jgi:hypothetical protein
MGNYIEEYQVAGLHLGIEDFNSPGIHFMPKMHKERYLCWVGGGGFGRAKTLDTARRKIYEYIVDRLGQELTEKRVRCRELEDVLFSLKDPVSLIPYMVIKEEEETET